MSNQSFNRFHDDKFSMNFSNVPSPDRTKIDMQIYDLYVKNLILPDFTLENVPSHLKATTILQPISFTNMQLSPITIEFKVSESCENYFLLYEWIQMIRYHQAARGETKLRESVIKSINVNFLDNQKRKTATFKFTNALITNLGSLSLTMGTADEVTFPVSFDYEEVKLIRV